MKPVFKCDFCDFKGTEADVAKHEATCNENYTRESCETCEHEAFENLKQIRCKMGKKVPEGHVYEHCDCYQRREKQKSDNPLTDIMRMMFSGI